MEKQFEKLELRVEKLDDKVDQIKEDIFVLRGDVKMYALDVQKHVAGDDKIITEVLPTIRAINDLLPELKVLAMEASARKINQAIETERKKKLNTNLTIAGTVVGIIVAILGFFFKD